MKGAIIVLKEAFFFLGGEKKAADIFSLSVHPTLYGCEIYMRDAVPTLVILPPAGA